MGDGWKGWPEREARRIAWERRQAAPWREALAVLCAVLLGGAVALVYVWRIAAASGLGPLAPPVAVSRASVGCRIAADGFTYCAGDRSAPVVERPPPPAPLHLPPGCGYSSTGVLCDRVLTDAEILAFEREWGAR